MEDQTITVSLGLTLCTNPDTRNFLRVGIEAHGVRLDGDVEEQAQAALTASLKVIRVLEDGLQEVVTEVIMESETPGLVRDTLASHEDKITRLTRLFSGCAKAIREMKESMGAGEEAESDVESTKETESNGPTG